MHWINSTWLCRYAVLSNRTSMRYQKVRVMQAKLNLSLCHQSFHPTIRRTKRGYIWPIAKKKTVFKYACGIFQNNKYIPGLCKISKQPNPNHLDVRKQYRKWQLNFLNNILFLLEWIIWLLVTADRSIREAFGFSIQKYNLSTIFQKPYPSTYTWLSY
jgi:hypothetical protein